MHLSSYEDLRSKLVSRVISCEDVVRYYLERIDRHQEDNIYISVFHEQALERARALDSKLNTGESLGKLFGLPMAIKDNIAMKGGRLTCASKILEHYESVYDATAVIRLEAEDAIFLGKTNMDEFAMGSSNENSAFGNVPNPFDKKRVPGGSSGKSQLQRSQGTFLTTLARSL